MKPPDITALDHQLETEVHEGDLRAAGEIAAPPASVAEAVQPLAPSPKAPPLRAALSDSVPMLVFGVVAAADVAAVHT